MSGLQYRCYGGCGRTFDSLDDMVAVAGAGSRSPRHFCPPCSWLARGATPVGRGGSR